MKKQTFIATICTLLLFFSSCTKSKTNSGGSVPPPSIQFDFILIDNDSNALFKVPDVFSTKFNPNKLVCTDEKGIPLYKNYNTYDSEGHFTFCNIDTLKSGQIFRMSLTDTYIANTVDSLQRCKYFISYDNKVFDTLVISYNGDYCTYNNAVINWYKNDKYPFYKGVFLVKK